MQYLFSRNIDLIFLYLPLTLLWGSFFILPEKIIDGELNLAVWVIFVLGIDVSHVWSTLFRTYFDKQEFARHKRFLLWSPLLIITVVFLLVYISISLFWSVLAYVAVFHFIKQQYGFLALYRYRTKTFKNGIKKWQDKLVIYGATVLPVLLWHLNPETRLAWFVEGDFINLKVSKELYQVLVMIFSSIYFLYFFYWIYLNLKAHSLRVGLLLWVIFTILNWYGAIVFLNSDFIFTTTNVVAHGVPYFVLMAFYKSKVAERTQKYNFLKWLSIIFFTVLLFAFVEEYFWDTLLFAEKPELFGEAWKLETDQSPALRALFFALLALPQIWHYFADGIIWKANDKNPSLRKVFK
ncbi:hypothetical protein SAMN05216474_1193 [Lishizhenia tianjinensis]|uniref:Uncharacterized protein n=1 Tax=Lishizhenia tianjinensis TaxID=477690 RepID=A0A1I6YUN5_9FLAO|nr:hypothetical protein [Lishizhenia tianjinensis]SFT54139.1 hypothetical protein SAMN05216474_1193 [Lishizhenia tianjinensis]